MKTCPIQELCQYFTSGDNKPPNAHVRLTMPCKKFIAMNCEMAVQLQEFITGKPVACDISKVRKIKKELK